MYKHAELAKCDLSAVLYELYGSEINVSISSFWDGGWEVKLGDEMNGFIATTNVKDIFAAGQWLAEEAFVRYPDSKFALLYGASIGLVFK